MCVFAACLPFILTSYSQPNESELARLDPLAEEYNVDRTVGRIRTVPFDAGAGFSFVVWGDMRSNPEVFERL